MLDLFTVHHFRSAWVINSGLLSIRRCIGCEYSFSSSSIVVITSTAGQPLPSRIAKQSRLYSSISRSLLMRSESRCAAPSASTLGESFVGLAMTLQIALEACGVLPAEHCTDTGNTCLEQQPRLCNRDGVPAVGGSGHSDPQRSL